MIFSTEEQMFGGRCGEQSHVSGLAMPAERIRGLGDPGRARWMEPHIVGEFLWLLDRRGMHG